MELVGTGGAARVLGLTVDRLRRAVNQGTVTPAAVTPGGHRRFAAADLANAEILRDANGNHRANRNGRGHASA